MKQSKIIAFLLLLIVSIPICMYLSNMLHLALSGEIVNIGNIEFKSVMQSLFENNKHLKLYILLQTLFLLFDVFVTFMQKENMYESELGNITNTIKTPVTVGQGQHGTARWLKESEYEKVFDKNIYDSSKDMKNQSFKSGGLVVGYKKLKNNNEEIYYVGENTHSLTVRCYKKW